MTLSIKLKPGRDKPLKQRHPWIFSGAIAKVQGEPASGAILPVYGADGGWLAWAEYSPASQIRARAFCWDRASIIDPDFWRQRLLQSIARRQQLLPHQEAKRLVFAESDGMPGLIVDQYGSYLVMQNLTAGAETRRQETAAQLAQLLEPMAIIERDDPVRRKEGLPKRDEVLFGSLPTRPITIEEEGLNFLVNLEAGQKTGFYLDQAANRVSLAPYCQDARVLNAFSYTGGFAVHALRAGAQHVVNVDTNTEALDLAAQNSELNGFSAERWQNIEASVFDQLRIWRDQGRQFDLIILDPPKFASGRKHLTKATRGYKDINWLAMRLLKPGGLLATFSCSGLVSSDLFQKIVFGAALDAGRDVRIVGRFQQAADHPVLVTFPEAAYLKGLLCHVT